MSRETVSFDVGSNSIKMVVLEGEGDHFQVKDYDIRELGLGQDASPDKFNSAVAMTIKTIMAEKRIKGKEISVSISGQSVFVRFVKLPAVDASKVDQIIRYEAQQQVPFPIEDVEWDHQVIGTADSGELDIVLVAVRKEVVASLVEAIEKVGFVVEVVDVSTVSLYNSFVFNEGVSESGTVLIEMGATTTNLLICAGDNLWARSIPIGGDNFTVAICKKMTLSMGVAEEMKRNAMIVTPDVPRDRIGDETIVQASEVLTKVASRVFTEISRSVGYFKSQWPGVSIGRVLLTGGGSSLTNIRGFLTSKLKTNVEEFSLFKRVGPPLGTDEGKQLHMSRCLSNAIGLGLSRLDAGRLSTNLLPGSVMQKRELAKKRVFIAAAAVMLIAAIVFQIFSLKSKTAEMVKAQDALEEVKKDDEARNSDIEIEERKHGRLKDPLDKIVKLQEGRLFWLNFIDILKAKKEDYVWFSSIQVLPPDVDVSSYIGASSYGGPGMGPGMGDPGSRRGARSSRGRRSRGAVDPGMADPGRGGEMDGERGRVSKPRSKLLLQGFLKVKGRRGRDIEELISIRAEDVKRRLEFGSEEDGTKYFDNVTILRSDPIEGVPNLAEFEISAELVNPLPEY
jgi:type IV pilus assembly protein PilM